MNFFVLITAIDIVVFIQANQSLSCIGSVSQYRGHNNDLRNGENTMFVHWLPAERVQGLVHVQIIGMGHGLE